MRNFAWNWPRSIDQTVTQSHSHTVTQSRSQTGQTVTKSHIHTVTVTQSHSHTVTVTVTQSHNHTVTQSHSHTVTCTVTQSQSNSHSNTVTVQQLDVLLLPGHTGHTGRDTGHRPRRNIVHTSQLIQIATVTVYTACNCKQCIQLATVSVDIACNCAGWQLPVAPVEQPEEECNSKQEDEVGLVGIALRPEVVAKTLRLEQNSQRGQWLGDSRGLTEKNILESPS